MAIFNQERKVVTVFKITFILILVSLIPLWLLGGGITKIIAISNGIHFTSLADLLSEKNAATFANFHLPGQIDAPQIDLNRVAEISSSTDVPGTVPNRTSYAGGSPYAGQVALREQSARSQSLTGQYVELEAVGQSSINISGWSLESAVTGNRAYIPQATRMFIQGEINMVSDVILTQGGRAIIATGASPVGVSFQENSCTGYLGTLQPFVPPLPQQCPSPLDTIVQTRESEANLGSSCFQYLQSLPSCVFPTSPPPTLTIACKKTIQSELSYNGCARTHKNDANFSSSSWRLYLAQGASLWKADHDVIRLLDQNGLLVDVLNY